MLTRPIVTLTTDFGINGPFAGVMKGVMLGINPNLRIVDISHAITPHNVLEASLMIPMSYNHFPPTTIHMVLVDPGVGGPRRPILIVTDDYYFIGPDNGIFTPVFESLHTYIPKVFHITASHYFLPRKGPTFHGRDIFAPVAAWLSKGVECSRFGEEITDYVKIKMPELIVTPDNILEGEVINIDNFGNAITNITQAKIAGWSQAAPAEKIKVIYKEQELAMSNYYAESEGIGLSSVINSSCLLEMFVYKDSASQKFGIKKGDKVMVKVI